jgi:hypothetical protein
LLYNLKQMSRLEIILKYFWPQIKSSLSFQNIAELFSCIYAHQ